MESKSVTFLNNSIQNVIQNVDKKKKKKKSSRLKYNLFNQVNLFRLYKFKFKYFLIILLKFTPINLVHSYHSSTSIIKNDKSSLCNDIHCLNGFCNEGKCICDKGWQGEFCQSCGGRVRLNNSFGFISDGKKNYAFDLQCTWLIDATNVTSETVIRLKFLEFETECNWDHLYIFNGDSVFSPLIAAFSGILIRRKQSGNELPDIEIKTKQLYLYFYSDTAYNMTGFNLFYSIISCQERDCSDVLSSSTTKSNDLLVHSEKNFLTDHCSTDKHYGNNSNCNCNDGINSLACKMPICPNKCSSHGDCNTNEKRCNCKPDYAGADCGQIKQESYWEALNSVKNQKVIGRALHQSVVIDNKMWVVGGEFFHTSEANDQFLMNFDFENLQWTFFEKKSNSDLKRFSHSLVSYNQSLYMYGGLLDNGTISNELWRYDILKNEWELIKNKNTCVSGYCAPLAVVGHTANVIDDRLLIFFGYNPKFGYLDKIQEYRFTTDKWSFVNPTGALVEGGFGHVSVYHKETKIIYIFGGHHSINSDSTLVDYLYAFYPYKNKWQLLTPSKSPRYFHSAVIINNQMYVFGGNAHNSTQNNYNYKCFSTQFLIYNIACDSWNFLSEPSDVILNNFGTGRFGHTSVVYNNEMYVFGGYNGIMLNNILKYIPANCSTLRSKNECCKFVLTLNCIWNDEKKLCMEFEEDIPSIQNNKLSSGMTSLTSSSKRIINNSPFSEGFNLCQINFNNFDRINSTLNSNGSLSKNKCPIKFKNKNELCKKQSNCSSCLNNSYGCSWCDDGCYYEKCKKSTKRISKTVTRCDNDLKTLDFSCKKYHNCSSCHTNSHCIWSQKRICSKLNLQKSDNRTFKTCDSQCSLQTNCENCTSKSCMWCSSLNRCIESNAYAAIFPLAQCMEWTINSKKCSSLSCSDQGTCEQCQKIHRCGWCDDGSGTGVGRCMEGTARGPYNPPEHLNSNLNYLNLTKDTGRFYLGSGSFNKHKTDGNNRITIQDMLILDKGISTNLEKYNGKNPFRFHSNFDNVQNTCKENRWYYTECPSCQCNGHSECKKISSSVCDKPCKNSTEGEHCEECKLGFFGDPVNGGRCQLCKCNIHSKPCDKRTGRCFCTTKGIIGPYCEKCDEKNLYFGNPIDSTCYYNLSIDFQYTFNMSKIDDSYFDKINFMNIPSKPDVDVDFTISCSNKAYFNISIGSPTLPMKVLQERVECGTYKYRYSHDEQLFGVDNNSFYVNVYSFSYPFSLQISFSQHRTLDLLQFFVTFSSCFLTLLIIAAILWKIKQKYDMYRRRQQFFMELEHLASRPFAGIMLDLPDLRKTNLSSPQKNNFLILKNGDQSPVHKKSKQKGGKSFNKTQLNSKNQSNEENIKNKSTNSIENYNPTPIALEPCYNNKAAVLSLVVRLPTGGAGVIPIGQTGLAIASALVSLGPIEQKMTKETEVVRKTNQNYVKPNNNIPAFV